MKWYEAIFGEDVWKHLVIETSFWKHSEEKATKRKLDRNVYYFNGYLTWNEPIILFQTDEESYGKSLNTKIHEKHPNIPDTLTIPVFFIDPVLHIYKDPCDADTLSISDREKEKFDHYTSR